jgi:hypothetical protein
MVGMDGVDFETYGPGAEANQAFSKAIALAREIGGRNGGSGTIAEKSGAGFVIVTDTPLWGHEAKSLIRKIVADEEDDRFSHKWSPCGAIPVVCPERSEAIEVTLGASDTADEIKTLATAALKKAGKLAKGETVTWAHLQRENVQSLGRDGKFAQGVVEVRIRRANIPPRHQVKFSFTVDGGSPEQSSYELVLAEATKRVRVKDGERVVDVSEITAAHTYHSVMSASNVPRSTRYRLVGDEAHDTWETGFSSQAAARSYAKKLIDQMPVQLDSMSIPVRFEIEAVTRRSDGSPLVLAERRIRKSVYRATATIERTVSLRGFTPDGWLFFGSASF